MTSGKWATLWLASLLGVVLLGSACSSTQPDPDPGPGDSDGTDAGTPDVIRTTEDLDGLTWEPKFEPDYNNLQPQPWVEVVTTHQAQTVVVTPDKLLFPKDTNPEVLQWEPGRVVVSAPSEGSGANPLGFARRVVSVGVVEATIVVQTETVALQDIVTGDMQQTFDFSRMTDVDLSKLDLEWASKSLYVDAEVLSPELEIAPDDEPMPDVDENGQPLPPGDPFFGKLLNIAKKGATAVGKAFGGAAQSVASAVKDVWKAVTPASFTGSVSVSPEIKGRYSDKLFTVDYKKDFNSRGRTPVQLQIKGGGNVAVDFTFRPGAQVGMRIPNIGHNTSFATWLNVDSQYRSKIHLDAELEAEVASAGGLSGNALEDELTRRSEFAEDVLTQARERFMGSPDMKPAGGWKRTVFITKPATQVVLAGPVPVVFTQTFQVDLECGFMAKAALKADMTFERNTNLRFSTRYENRAVTGTTPIIENRKSSQVKVTGGGSLEVSCGLIPRINVFVYDTAGLNAGVRGSMVARAQYESQCSPDPLVSKPTSKVTLGLYGNLGIQLGGRLQAPGSSFLGKDGLKAGTDIGPFELSNFEFEIFKHDWHLNGGLGYCTPLCRNAQKDGRETDLNCGGGACGGCAEGKGCAVNSDCLRGYCSAGRCSSTNHCADGVRDGDETGLDCGGSRCKPCQTGLGCFLPRDCASGFCAVVPGNGSGFGRCVQNHCADYTQNADESGLDCGGGSCAKCALGARSAVAADCVTGYSDGQFCVANTCRDRVRSGGESDVDCGGATACARCAQGQRCGTNADCAASAPVCDQGSKVCSRPLCFDNVRNGDETDIDCGGSCSARCAESMACLQHSDCATGLECDPVRKVCVTPFTCGAGQYSSHGVCTDVGVGYWSPAGDVNRYACSNAPANAVYTSSTASSADCPWTCAAGYLRNPSTHQCELNSTARYIQCAADEVAVGIHGRAGAWLDALGVRCARFESGQITGSVRDVSALGGSGGDAFSLTCGAGQVLYRVTGYNGWSTSSPNANWCNATNLSTVKIWCQDLMTGTLQERGQAGGSNGNCTKPAGPEYSFDCGAGQYINGLVVDSANTSMYVGHMLDRTCR